MEDYRLDEVIAELNALQIQVARLEAEVNRRENKRDPQSAIVLPQVQQVKSEYAVGDRVRILNKVKKPATWDNRIAWCETSSARQATVTEVRPKQIFSTTDNGIETWRAPNNLRKVYTDQHE